MFGDSLPLRVRLIGPIVPSPMKNLLILTVTAIAMASFVTTTLAGDGCGGGEKKEGDKTEESTQS